MNPCHGPSPSGSPGNRPARHPYLRRGRSAASFRLTTPTNAHSTASAGSSPASSCPRPRRPGQDASIAVSGVAYDGCGWFPALLPVSKKDSSPLWRNVLITAEVYSRALQTASRSATADRRLAFQPVRPLMSGTLCGGSTPMVKVMLTLIDASSGSEVGKSLHSGGLWVNRP